MMESRTWPIRLHALAATEDEELGPILSEAADEMHRLEKALKSAQDDLTIALREINYLRDELASVRAKLTLLDS